MIDSEISVNALWACGLGILGALLIGAGIFLPLPVEVGMAGLFVAGVGHLFAMRRMSARMHAQQRAAFELGRDSVRSVH